jgi:Tfp pilus assembly protein PilF
VLCERLDFTQGIACLKKALETDPDNSDYGYGLATAYANSGILSAP